LIDIYRADREIGVLRSGLNQKRLVKQSKIPA